jgi:hypothetical protein
VPTQRTTASILTHPVYLAILAHATVSRTLIAPCHGQGCRRGVMTSYSKGVH